MFLQQERVWALYCRSGEASRSKKGWPTANSKAPFSSGKFLAAFAMRDNSKWDFYMDRSTIIARLREHEGELKAAGIEHLSLHGSYARGTPIGGLSDVDVIADFDGTKKLSLIGRVHLENRLTDILGIKADLADRAMLRPEVLERAQRESVIVF